MFRSIFLDHLQAVSLNTSHVIETSQYGECVQRHGEVFRLNFLRKEPAIIKAFVQSHIPV
jgi:hypothetical protein